MTTKFSFTERTVSCKIVPVIHAMLSKQVHPSSVSSDAGRFFALLLVAVCLVGSAFALNCKICHSTGDYEACLRSSSAPCTVSLVNTTHLFLASANPTLRNVTFVGVPQFQCFQVNYTVGVMWHYQMGCTYATTKICEGWRAASKCLTTTSNVMGVPGRVRPPHIADYNPHGPPVMIHPVHQGHPVQHPAATGRNTKSASASNAMAVECLVLAMVVGWAIRKMLGHY
ncbi:uncharacterized protein LOC118503587 [Anopheles stephensi]|uniref:uncharacterized protein LOC118503587 n=1 Tax=Anopheles stephensi TaxID=30069 RepID=UPI0016587185|nr:uncharacterized protein LOC118503587 [Anopheles stephensi]